MKELKPLVMRPPKTKLEAKVQRYLNLVLGGRMLVIDPSSGSKKSQPGFAWYVAGRLEQSGTINLPASTEKHIKLRLLANYLRGLIQPDVLVIEDLPPYMSKEKMKWFNKSLLNLHHAVGAVLSSVQCDALIEISPVSWRKFIPADYVKSDENDAIMMGYTALATAHRFMGLPPPELSIRKDGVCAAGGDDVSWTEEEDEED